MKHGRYFELFSNYWPRSLCRIIVLAVMCAWNSGDAVMRCLPAPYSLDLLALTG